MNFKTLLTLAIVVSMSTICFAKGPFITPGARAAGNGTAFIATADDLTAIYYNPAGLAYQQYTQVMLTSFFIDYTATSSEKTELGSDKYNTSAVVPFGAFSTPIYKDVIIALGVYAIGGGGGKVEDLPAECKIEGQQSFMVYNISLAKQITDKFSVGLGFDAIQMQDKLVQKITYSAMGYPYPGYAVDTDYNRSAFGFQGNIGLMYKPIEKLSTGFILRTGTYIGLPTELNASNQSFVNGCTYPLTTEIGFSYEVLKPLIFSASLGYNKYSWASEKYRDTFQVKVGTEYKATDRLSLHLGYFNDPNIYKNISDVGVSGMSLEKLTDVDMYNMNYLTVGAEYKVYQELKLGLMYAHSFTQEVCYNGIGYDYDVNIVRFDISYKFL